MSLINVLECVHTPQMDAVSCTSISQSLNQAKVWGSLRLHPRDNVGKLPIRIVTLTVLLSSQQTKTRQRGGGGV